MTRRWLGLALVIAACAQIEPGDDDATSVGGHTAASPSPQPSGGAAGAIGSGGASGASDAAGSGGDSEDASGEAEALVEDSASDAMDEATDAPYVCVGDAAAATTCWFKVYGLCFDTLAAACDCLACPLEQCKATGAKKGRLNWGVVKDVTCPPPASGDAALE